VPAEKARKWKPEKRPVWDTVSASRATRIWAYCACRGNRGGGNTSASEAMTMALEVGEAINPDGVTQPRSRAARSRRTSGFCRSAFRFDGNASPSTTGRISDLRCSEVPESEVEWGIQAAGFDPRRRRRGRDGP